MNQPALISDTRSIPLPAWMPQQIREQLAGQPIRLPIYRPVRLRCRRPVKIPVSMWAAQNRIVTDGDHTGNWRHDFAPHTVEIMDTFGKPYVREVWYCKVEQSGGTNSLLNCLGHGIMCDPGDAFLLMPTEEAAQKMAGQKLKPMLKESRGLRELVSSRADDTTMSRINLTNGVTIHMAHANSPSSMATYSAKFAFGDEVDKYPEMAGREADPITLIRKRGRTYRGKVKRFFCSTPAQRFIYKGMTNCHQIKEARVRCPDCSAVIKMDTEHLIIPEGVTPENVDQRDVQYSCNDCGSIWDEDDRIEAIRLGAHLWPIVKGADVSRPAKVGFHHTAWECLDVTMAEIAAAWLKSKTGDLSAKIAWANGYEAIDFADDLSDRKEDAILRLCDDRYSGVVHPNSDVLTIHIDTQDKGFWYEIRGWQYGPSMTSWLVKAGYLPSARPDDFSALDQLIFEDKYSDQSGKEYLISYGIIDSGGHRTSEVYAWCKQSGIFASKGAKGRKAQPVTLSNQEFYPNSNKPIPGGLKLYVLDTHFHKDMLANKLKIDATDPGAWVLHSGYSEIQRQMMETSPEIPLENGLAVYAKHFTVEYRDDKGAWQCPAGKRNDLWDCAQMGIGLARYLGFHEMVSENEQKATQPATQQPTSGSSRPSWFNQRGR